MRVARLLAKLVAGPALLLVSLAAGAADYPPPREGDWVVRGFRFHTGEVLNELHLHYLTIGDPSGEPVVILHGTAGSGASFLTPAFAGELFGPGQPLDAGKFFIILPDAIGAVYPLAVVQTCIVHMIRYSLSFVSYKDRRAVVTALREVYAAPSEAVALAQLEAFETAWSKRYPMIGKSWRSNWEQVRPFLELPPALRKLVYTTNAIESLNYQLRKVIKTKGHFPSDEAAFKLLFLALRNIERRWHAKSPPAWKQIYAQLHVRFGERAQIKA